MSRIGKQPITVPQGVDVAVADSRVTVKGPRGQLEQSFHRDMRIILDDGTLRVERPDDEREHRSLHGLTRTLIANMVEGVTNGYEKRLEIVPRATHLFEEPGTLDQVARLARDWFEHHLAAVEANLST